MPATSRLPLLRIVCVLLAFVSVSCSVFEKGAPTAAITVRAESADDVEAAVVDVFSADGYRVTRRDTTGIVMEHPASATDHVLYGNWNGAQLLNRVQVTIVPAAKGSFRVSCFPYAVRGGSDEEAFQDPQRRVELFSLHHGSLLRKVRRNLR